MGPKKQKKKRAGKDYENEIEELKAELETLKQTKSHLVGQYKQLKSQSDQALKRNRKKHKMVCAGKKEGEKGKGFNIQQKCCYQAEKNH